MGVTYLTLEQDWDSLLIALFNNKKCFLNIHEIYSITNFIIALFLFPLHPFHNYVFAASHFEVTVTLCNT